MSNTPFGPVPWDPYPSGPYTDPFFRGGLGGEPWTSCSWTDNGVMVQSLQVWSGPCGADTCIKAFEITYTNGSKSPIYGGTELSSWPITSITFQPGEKVTELALWPIRANGYTGLGHIRLRTDRNNLLDVGQNIHGIAGQSAPIGSGLLVGAAGHCGAAIDRLSFVFLTDVASVNISHVLYATNPAKTSEGISRVILDNFFDRNPNKSGMSSDWKRAVERINSSNWVQHSANGYGISATVTASVFKMTFVDGIYRWLSQAGTFSSPKIEPHQLSWDIKGTLEANMSVTATASCSMGILSIPYTSSVQVLMTSGGSSFSFSEGGTFICTAYSPAVATLVVTAVM